MTLLFAIGMLLALALAVVMAATRAQKERTALVEAAKLRSEMRSNAKDVWEATVPAKAAIHDIEPIKYDTTVRHDSDISDSQYQILMTIFSETHPEFRTNTDHARLESDYWKDTDHTGLSHE